MESSNIESHEPLLHDQSETSSKLKQEVAPQSPYRTGSKRPYRDPTFTFLFLTAILTTFTFGIIASTRTDTLNMDTKLRLSNYNPTTNKCEITQQQPPKASDSVPNSDYAFETLVALTSLFALALTIPFSLLLVSLLRRYTHTLFLLFAPFLSLLFLGLSLSGGLLWFSWYFGVWGAVTLRSKQIFDLVFFSCTSALLAYKLWKNWTGSAVESGVEVLRMAMGFWKEHFVLLVVNPVLLMGWMVLVNGPILTFMWSAFNVGELVPDFDAVNDPIKGCGLVTGIRCCREERPGWVYAYITFASFTAFWVLMVSVLLQHAVVSGTVTHWYFAPTGSSAVGNMKRSLGNAYGPSFGTACNLATIVTTLYVIYVRHLKEILSDRVLKSNGQGMMLSILRGCLSRMSQFPDQYPQLPSVFLGIWESSRESHHNLLQRTSPISTAMTHSHDLAIQVLYGMTILCTLLQTLVVYGVLEYFSNAFALTKLLIAGVYCFPITMIGLGTGFSQAVSSVITAVSVCYALERDAGRDLQARGLSCIHDRSPHLHRLKMGLKLKSQGVVSEKQTKRNETTVLRRQQMEDRASMKAKLGSF